jgi:hypothetical protein
MKRPVTVALPVCFTLVFAGLLIAEKGATSIAGTWKLDVAKSKYSTGTLPKGATRTVEAQGDGEKTTVEEVEPDGSNFGYSYTVTYGEKDYPITRSGTVGNDPLGGAETIAIRRYGSSEYGAALRKSGQVVMTMREVVSKKGQTLTITSNGADAKGQPTTFVTVWDKQ